MNSLGSAQWQDQIGCQSRGGRFPDRSGERPSTTPHPFQKDTSNQKKRLRPTPPFLILLLLPLRFFRTSKARSPKQGLSPKAQRTSYFCERNTYERYYTSGKRSSYQKYASQFGPSTSRVDFSIRQNSRFTFPLVITLADFSPLQRGVIRNVDLSSDASSSQPPIETVRSRPAQPPFISNCKKYEPQNQRSIFLFAYKSLFVYPDKHRLIGMTLMLHFHQYVVG